MIKITLVDLNMATAMTCKIANAVKDLVRATGRKAFVDYIEPNRYRVRIDGHFARVTEELS